MLLTTLLFVTSSTLDTPRPLSSRIDTVTVYGSSALVQRTARVEGGGAYVFRDLPAALDASNVRVKCTSGDVGRVEVRARRESKVPSERLQELRVRLARMQRELETLQDEEGTAKTLGDTFERMAALDAANHAREVQSGSGDPARWKSALELLRDRRAELVRARRALGWKIADHRAAMDALQKEIGTAQSAPSVNVHDVALELVANGPGEVELEYFVSNTGWTPVYDVRASKDLASVALLYRARVWQDTGEEWNGVELALSTAQPQRGAQGPEPVTTWVDVFRPPEYLVAGKTAPASLAMEDARRDSLGRRLADGDTTGEDDQSARPFAAVEDLGLSARFQIAKLETIPSRRDPTTVLVGEHSLPIVPERWCTPALDTTVWLRAKAKNSSPWILLPGTASVFLGADYVGKAALESVQTGQEFTLHLGADPAIAVTRTQVKDLSKEPAFLSNRETKLDTWRIRLENHGAVATAPDGSVEVIVREVLPKTRDARIEIEMTKANPPWSSAERWKQDREERGIHTWLARAPRGGHADVVVETSISFPTNFELVRN